MLFEAQDFNKRIKVWNHLGKDSDSLQIKMIVPKNVQIEKKDLATDMIFVEGGTFEMGSPNEEDNAPLHAVSLSSFYISKHQVTQMEYLSVAGKVHKEWLGNNFPEHYVNWIEAVIFCNKASVAEGFSPCYSFKDSKIECDWNANGYRLPTEAEWEYAARGGIKNDGTIYSGSDNIDEVAWYCDNSEGMFHEVMTKKPNGLGIYDMSGNVLELCWEIQLDSNASYARGGCSIYCPQEHCSVFARAHAFRIKEHDDGVGFRLVRTKL